MTGDSQKFFWLNLAVYALTLLLFGVITWFISENFDDSDRRLPITLMLVGAYFFGKFANWLVKKLFGVCISK